MKKSDQRLRNQVATWNTPHGMAGTDASGKLGAGGEFAKQATQWPTPIHTFDSGPNNRYQNGNTKAGRMLSKEAEKFGADE
jgi:hypothetical protein